MLDDLDTINDTLDAIDPVLAFTYREIRGLPHDGTREYRPTRTFHDLARQQGLDASRVRDRYRTAEIEVLRALALNYRIAAGATDLLGARLIASPHRRYRRSGTV